MNEDTMTTTEQVEAIEKPARKIDWVNATKRDMYVTEHMERDGVEILRLQSRSARYTPDDPTEIVQGAAEYAIRLWRLNSMGVREEGPITPLPIDSYMGALQAAMWAYTEMTRTGKLPK